MANKHEHHPEYSKYPASGIRARELGELYYFTGKRCSKGHLSLRYASSGNCVDCFSVKQLTVKTNFRGRSSKRSAENQQLAEQAFNKGHKTYIPKDACKHGHKERFIGSNNCVICSLQKTRQRAESAKWARIKKQYGISKEQFNQMLSIQENKCSICKCDLTNKNTHIDHCHSSGNVRSLLCSRCNQAIGLLDEDEQKLNTALEYIRKHNAA